MQKTTGLADIQRTTPPILKIINRTGFQTLGNPVLKREKNEPNAKRDEERNQAFWGNVPAVYLSTNLEATRFFI